MQNTINVWIMQTCIDGSTLPSKIAAPFRELYANIYVNSADDECKVTEYNKLRLHYVGDNKTDISVTVQDVEHAINQLKFRKAVGIDGFVSEHILHSHPCIIVHLKLLFHMMLLHGYVSNNFGLGVIIPIL